MNADNMKDLAINAGLEEFVRRYSPALRRYFRKRGLQEATVEDLVQDVFVRLAARQAVDEIRNPEAYLMRSASNVWRDMMRKRATHQHEFHIEYQDDMHANEVFSPDRVYLCREKIITVLNALQVLPETSRWVFVLCRIEGMKQKDVAARLGISVSSVEKHMMKAIAVLTECVGDEN